MDNGLKIIEENPDQHSNLRAHVGDLDVAGAYPNNGSVFNISKQTTHKELCKIEGVPEAIQRSMGINLSAGHTNATEFCTHMFGMPSFENLLSSFEKNVA